MSENYNRQKHLSSKIDIEASSENDGNASADNNKSSTRYIKYGLSIVLFVLLCIVVSFVVSGVRRIVGLPPHGGLEDIMATYLFDPLYNMLGI